MTYNLLFESLLAVKTYRYNRKSEGQIVRFNWSHIKEQQQ